MLATEILIPPAYDGTPTAAGEAAITLHPPLPSVGVFDRRREGGYPQHESLADGYLGLPEQHAGPEDVANPAAQIGGDDLLLVVPLV